MLETEFMVSSDEYKQEEAVTAIEAGTAASQYNEKHPNAGIIYVRGKNGRIQCFEQEVLVKYTS